MMREIQFQQEPHIQETRKKHTRVGEKQARISEINEGKEINKEGVVVVSLSSRTLGITIQVPTGSQFHKAPQRIGNF